MLRWVSHMRLYILSGDKSLLPDGVELKGIRHHSDPEFCCRPAGHPSMGAQLMTPGELAEELGLCRDTVLRWKRGEGPRVIRLGPRTIRYNRKDVEVWLKGREHK